MNNYCIYLRKRKNKPFCKLLNKEIPFCRCQQCGSKEYKSNVNQIKKRSALKEKSLLKIRKMKTKSNRLAKLEKNRFSVFTNNKDKCMFCPSTYHLTWHEIYRGRNRQNSMKYKLCLRMCDRCHDKYQEDIEFNNHWHKKGQLAFITNYPNLKFEDIFKINYLD